MNQEKPLHKVNLTLKDLGDEFLIYSSERKEIHVINPTGRMIWDMCDGLHTISEMEKELREHFSVPAERDLAADIQATIGTFREKGLLQNEN
jgi:hypothetical protein